MTGPRLRPVSIILLFAIATWAEAREPARIRDPLADFFGQGEIPETGELLEFHTDLDRDGSEEIFLSWPDVEGNRAGNDWAVYLPREGNFAAGEIVTLRPDLLYAGGLAGYTGDLLLSYHPSNAREGSLHGVQIINGSLYEIRLGLIQPRGRDLATFDQFFDSDHSPKMRVHSRVELAAQFPAYFTVEGKPISHPRPSGKEPPPDRVSPPAGSVEGPTAPHISPATAMESTPRKIDPRFAWPYGLAAIIATMIALLAGRVYLRRR